jgi:flagellar hook-associated protein 3 FlgL
MIGRMSSAQMHQGSLNVIFDAQARLQQTQESLATGKRLNSASDDPVASAQITSIRAELSRLEVLQTNANRAYDELAMTEASLSTAEDLISRAREIAVQGANSVLGPEDRAILATEVEAIRDQMLKLANTQSPMGDYIFAGHAVGDPAFTDTDGVVTYAGDDGKRLLNIAPGIQLSVRFNGDNVFGEGAEGTFAALKDLEAALLGGEDAAIQDSITNMDTAQQRILNRITELGSRMGLVEDQQLLNETFNVQLQDSLSGLEDIDYAKAISEMNLQMVALQAAQQTYTQTKDLNLFNYL